MVPEWLQRLLILQDRDSRCDGIKRQLGDIPKEIEKEEAAIAALETELLEAEKLHKQMEAKRNELEGEVASVEEQIVKYKTQQMQVKKNDEYTAFEKEIGFLKEKISGIEDEELLLLDQLEESKEALEERRRKTEEERATLQAHIELLNRNYTSCEAELGEAESAVVASEADIPADILKTYQYVKTQVRRPPVVVPMEDSRCRGCHLKVSGDIETLVRRGQEIARCGSCGRILYFDR
jgi:hypothetical protein